MGVSKMIVLGVDHCGGRRAVMVCDQRQASDATSHGIAPRRMAAVQ
jgi:carbonic anhydrase